MKKGRVNATYDEAYTRARRTFPVKNTLLLVLIVAVQICLILIAVFYNPTPQDVIHAYRVAVKPMKDGSLDIEYHFLWEALDDSEDLTWVEIGMANENFTVYPHSVSPNIHHYEKYTEEGYVSLQLDFKRAYKAGDVVEFSFKVNQKDMLCKNETGYFYEFVPGWFNAIQVKHYDFCWLIDGMETAVQQGSLDYGEYRIMELQYGPNDFSGCQTVEYEAFDDSGASDEILGEKIAVIVICCIIGILLIIAQVNIVDSYVSYGRGRGFLTGHGYHVHIYGQSNPHYIRARDKYNAQHAGRSSGRGCACACACACAGGGRAGCSQKDTYSNTHRSVTKE